MTSLLSAAHRPMILLLALLASGAIATAQETAPEGDAPAAEAPAEVEPTAPESTDGATDAEPAPEEEAPSVTVTQHGDWEVRCEDSSGNCFMYQLVRNDAGNPVAEVRLVRLPEGGEAAAGATVITPLGSLLSEGLVLQVDEGEARQYPFNWCVRSGCFAQFGLSAAEVTTMRAGSVARMRIVAVSAPDQPVILNMSLGGFTAAHNALVQ